MKYSGICLIVALFLIIFGESLIAAIFVSAAVICGKGLAVVA